MSQLRQADMDTAPVREVRADVVAAAIEVFREKGYERATVREIAERAGLGTSSLYFHVRSKEQLALAAVRPVVEEGAAWLEELVASDQPPEEKLRAAIVRAVELYERHPAVTLYLSDFYPVVDRLLPEAGERAKAAWAELVRQVLAAGGAPVDERRARLLSFAVLGMASWMHRWFRPDGPVGATELGHLYADLVLDGLRPR
jgi:AcrR family transcriptional regulator